MDCFCCFGIDGTKRMTEFNFDNDMSVREIPFKIKGENYILREASGSAIAAYKNARLEKMTLSDTGKPKTVKGMGDVEPLLVSLCSFQAETNQQVPLQTVLSWPGRVVSKLFDEAKKISEIDVPDTVEGIDSQIKELQRMRDELVNSGETSISKNEQDSTGDGSN